MVIFMLFNLITGFLVPLTLTIILFKKAPEIVLVIFPLACILSHTINSLGVFFNYWKLIPDYPGCISYLLFNIGLYGFLSSLMIFLISNNKNTHLTIFLFALITTLIELVGVQIGKVIYANGWNIIWTFISYFIPYLLIYWYYRLLHRYRVFY